MKNEEIRLSIALVTRNRPESLDRCLASVRTQSVQPWEILVSDDSDEEMAKSTRDISSKWGCRYEGGPHRGLYANRNRAALFCEGSHIRTMDDDHVLPPGHLEKCLQWVQTDPAAFWSTGEDGTINGRPVSSAETALELGKGGVGYFPQNPDDTWAYADGSTIYSRSVIDRGLWMVEETGYGSWYLEYGAYLYAHGYRGRSIPGVKVQHRAEIRMDMGGDVKEKDLESRLYASLVFSLYFRPSVIQSLRQVPFWLQGGGVRRLRKIWPLVKRRWGALPASGRYKEWGMVERIEKEVS